MTQPNLDMRILSFKPGHDGHIAYLDNGKLVFSLESEKDSWPRYSRVTPTLLIRAVSHIPDIPDVVAISGWVKGFHPAVSSEGFRSISLPDGSGYFGESEASIFAEKQLFFGKQIQYFSSSHERSHIFCAYGLSPFPQGQPCYALVWEGNIGAFYYVDESVKVTKIGDVLEEPGNKYAYLYALADPTFPLGTGNFRFEDAGKLMALSSFGNGGIKTLEEEEIIQFLLNQKAILLSFDKNKLKDSQYYNVGVESQMFKDLSKKYSDEIFNIFHSYAKKHLNKNLPLLISGGCGLNCDWNSQWKLSGLFEDVFVPPCPNDSGSAIGTAVEAQYYFTGNSKIDWSVYSGEEFVIDEACYEGINKYNLSISEVALFLAHNKILAWVQDKYEIGPRSLGNRSILAAPFSKDTHQRLNRIKQREDFRPIAPMCLEEDIDTYFENYGISPYMLYFQRVKTDCLKAITHVDGSARMQSVNKLQNKKIYDLLTAFKAQTGYGVLCNTSLNFKGTGFINRMSDLIRYVRDRNIDGFVVGKFLYVLEKE
jgi:hydroxymethyl cephem carbamoyltransferase